MSRHRPLARSSQYIDTGIADFTGSDTDGILWHNASGANHQPQI